MTKKNAREFAFNILQEIIISDAYSNIALNKFFTQNIVDEKDKRYITELVYGTVKNKIYLEHILKSYSTGRVKPKVKILLIMSIYQIINMDKTPDFATVNEAVQIAKKEFGLHTSKFVNGVLRNIIRTFDSSKLNYKNKIEQVCIENSSPKELFDILTNQYGESALDIVKSFNNKVGNSIRFNPLKTSKEKLLSYFNDELLITAKESDICEDCLILDKLNIKDKYFQNGNYIIQDEASALVACSLNLDVKNKYNILDVCAAPGGKSLHIASKYKNSNVVSCDKYLHKLNLIEQNKERLGINNITVKEQDATILNKDFIGKFDIVVCDVPCSGIGVIKNKPEIKYKITNGYVEDITKLQYKILTNSLNYVKEGGILLYSTCTIDKRENEDNINKFLSDNHNFKLEKIKLNNSLVSEEKEGILNILPHKFDCDGFFIAKLRKVGK